MINNTATSSLYKAINSPTSSALYPNASYTSLTSQVKPKVSTPVKVNLTGNKNASSLFNNPLSLSSVPTTGLMPLSSKTAPVSKPSIPGLSLIPKASASTVNPAQSNAGNAFTGNGLNLASLTPPATQAKTTATTTSTNTQPQYTAPNSSTQTQIFSSQNSNQNNPGSPAPVRGLFPDVLSSLVKRAGAEDDATKKAREDLLKFQTGTSDKIADIMSDTIPLEFQQGRAQVVQQASTEKQSALQQAVANSIEARGQTLNALGTAAGLAQPQQVPYSNQLLDPQTGQPIAGAGSSLDGAVSTIAQRVQAGQMSYDEGVKALSGYGQGGVNALQKALGSNFNPLSSNSLAGSRGGIIQDATTDIANMQTNLTAADTNLEQLTALAKENGINDLSSITGNKITNLFRKEFSDSALLSYQALLNGTRALYTAVLESRANLSPTEAFNLAQSFVPENTTVGSLRDLTKTLRTEAETIISSKQSQVENAQNPGQNSSQNLANSNSLFSW